MGSKNRKKQSRHQKRNRSRSEPRWIRDVNDDDGLSSEYGGYVPPGSGEHESAARAKVRMQEGSLYVFLLAFLFLIVLGGVRGVGLQELSLLLHMFVAFVGGFGLGKKS